MNTPTPTPTPAHVALIEAHFSAVFHYATDSEEDRAYEHVEAAQAILDALAAPVPSNEYLRELLTEAKDTIDSLPGYPKGADLCDRIEAALGTQQPTPAASPAMRTVSEEEALQGGRWVSSDDVQRMTQQIHRAMYPDVAPPVNCLLCDIVAEVCARLESEVMQPVEAAKPERFCNKCGYIGTDTDHQLPSGAECRYISRVKPKVEVAAPVAPIEPHTLAIKAARYVFDGPYTTPKDVIDYIESHIEAAPAAQPQVLSDAQIDAATAVWFGTTDPHKAYSWRSHMRAAIEAAQAGGEA